MGKQAGEEWKRVEKNWGEWAQLPLPQTKILGYVACDAVDWYIPGRLCEAMQHGDCGQHARERCAICDCLAAGKL